MLASTAEKEPDELHLLMLSSNRTRSYPSFHKPWCDPENLPSSSVLSGTNKARAETDRDNFQKLNGKFKIGTHPYKRHMTDPAELKSPNNCTECNANIFGAFIHGAIEIIR